MASADAHRDAGVAGAAHAAGAQLSALEAALGREYEALMARDPQALIVACRHKLAALQALSSFRQSRPSAPAAWRSRLRAAVVANARNQTLLSVLRARVEDRVRALGMAGSVYDHAGQRRISVSTRSFGRG